MDIYFFRKYKTILKRVGYLTGHRKTNAINTNNKILSLLCVLFVSSINIANAAVTFQQVSGPFKARVESWGLSWADSNNDSYPDIFVNNHRDMPTFYMNNKTGGFTNSTSFVDVSRTWFNKPLTDQHGAAWADFDNDGDQDLFVTTGFNYDAQLFVNSGNGQLVNQISNFPVMRVDREGRLPIWLDNNRDGRMDLVVSTGGTSIFYQQNGNGTFSNKTGASGIAVTDNTTSGILWDVNRDNQLDLVMVNDGPFPEAAFSTNSLPFTNISGQIPSVSSVLDVLQGDFDRDLRNDVFLVRGALRQKQVKRVNDKRIEARMHMGAGQGDKGFEFKTTGVVTLVVDSTQYASAFKVRIGSNGVTFADQDGTPDNKITTIKLDPANPKTVGLLANRMQRYVFVGYTPATKIWKVRIGLENTGPPPASRAYFIVTSTTSITSFSSDSINGVDKSVPGVLLLNKANGIVNSTSSSGQLKNPVSCVSGATADFDNDMDMDIYLVCRGGVENIPNILFENTGAGSFTRHNNAWGAQSAIGVGLQSFAGTGENAAVADFNLDGFMDVYVTNGLNMRPFRHGGPNHLFRNTGNNNKWVQFDLQGTASTRDGIGARVIVTAGGVQQLREQNGGYKRWGQNLRRLHFGLGANNAFNVQVQWPSGIVSNFNNVAANKIYRVIEGGGIQVVTPGTGGGGGGSTTPIFVVSDATKVEGTGAMNFTVTASPAPTSQISVTYATTNNTAVSGSDYVASSGTLTFQSGQSSKTVSVNITNDSEAEPDENFTFDLSNPAGGLIGDNQGIGTIIDDDSGGGGGGQSTLSINDVTKTEGTGSAKVVVTLSPASTSQVKVRVKTSNGTATAGSDYNAKNVLLTFAPGVTTQNVWVRILNDGQSEADETINTTLSDVTNALIGDGTGLVTIKDDDGGGGTGGLSTLSINDVTKTEGTGSAKVVVTLSPASTSQVKVRVKTSNGTATAGSDYNAKNVLLTFAPGVTTQNVWVRILNDGQSEADETINTTLSDVTNALIGDGMGLVTIKDDDGGGGTGGQSTLSINDVTKTEGTGSAKVVVTLSPASTSQVKVRVKTSNGTAIAGSDYNAKNVLLTFSPGVTTQNVWVPITNDAQGEPDETFNATLSEVTNAVIGDGAGIVTIKDNDGGGGSGGGQSVLSINNVSKQEGTGSAKLTLKLTPASTQQVKVNFVTVNGTAKSGSDYAFKSGTYTFDAGVTTKSLFIYIKPDTVTEGNESFTVKLSAPVNATIGDDTGIVTIIE